MNSKTGAMTTTKSTIRTSRIRNNSQLLNRNRMDYEELSSVNIYREHRGYLEQDKKARIELNTQIIKDNLYEPVQESTSQHNSKHPSRAVNVGNPVSFSFAPSKFLPTSFGDYRGISVDGGHSDSWGYYPNDIFASGVMMDSLKGVCCS
ncbi:9069_t:CDS:1 [Dentiscutata erythropus]|uniref:9069_t:CDS:1 n=1 Tax=Dentiscutata erythropus TaxID=1348616 RepID=A0A9N9E8I8_9GLOM|nr:9069_t:CDS:1 [Dentiscutata erythropus]